MCSFVRWSVRCGQETRRRGRSGEQFVRGTVFETGGVGLTQGHVGKSQGCQEADYRGGEHLSHELYWVSMRKTRQGGMDGPRV